MVLVSGAPEFTLSKDVDKKVIDDNLSLIIKNIDFAYPGDFYTGIYLSDAPMEFIKLYGSDFFNAIGMNIPYQEADDFYYESIVPNINDIQSLLYSCEMALPDDPIFDEYKPLFSTYIISVDRLFDYLSTGGEPGHLLIRNIRMESEEMWNGFVLGSRILHSCHDEDYDPVLDDWRRRYFENLGNLKDNVDVFYDFVFNIVKDRCEYELEDEGSKTHIKINSPWAPEPTVMCLSW